MRSVAIRVLVVCAAAACGAPPRARPSVSPPSASASATSIAAPAATIASPAEPPIDPEPKDGASPFSIALEECAGVRVASVRGATIVTHALEAARVDGVDLRPLPTTSGPAARPYVAVDITDVVGRWPDGAFVTYALTSGEGAGRTHVAPLRPDRVEPDVTSNAVAVYDPWKDGTTLLVTTDARDVVAARTLGGRPLRLELGAALSETTRSGLGLGLLAGAAALGTGELFVVAERDVAVHHAAIGKLPVMESIGHHTSDGVDALPLVVHGPEVYAALVARSSAHPGSENVLARFADGSWSETSPPPGGPFEAFDVSADGSLWVVLDGALLRRDAFARGAWARQPIEGHVARVLAAKGSSTWAITQWRATPRASHLRDRSEGDLARGDDIERSDAE